MTIAALTMSIGLVPACGDDDDPGDGTTDTTGADTTGTDTTVTDTGVPPTDTGVPPTDTNVEPDTTVPPDTTPPGPQTCDDVTLVGNVVQNPQQPNQYIFGDGETDLGFGGPEPDVVSFEFYSEDVGTFDLGSGENANYGTCSQCVLVLTDIVDGAATRFQLHAAGSLTVNNAPQSEDLQITVSGLKVAEVTIDSESFQSTPVADGACGNIADGAISTPPCQPVCGDNQICGDNACGGICGTGCAGQVCSFDEASCVAAGETINGVLDGDFQASPSTNNDAAARFSFRMEPIGQEGDDIVIMELYGTGDGFTPPLPGAGTYDLTMAPNDNYGTCVVCVRGFAGGRQFFANAGTVELDAATTPDGQALQATLTGVQLVEVDIASGTFVSTPVVNGHTLVLESPAVLSVPTGASTPADLPATP